MSLNIYSSIRAYSQLPLTVLWIHCKSIYMYMYMYFLHCRKETSKELAFLLVCHLYMGALDIHFLHLRSTNMSVAKMCVVSIPQLKKYQIMS